MGDTVSKVVGNDGEPDGRGSPPTSQASTSELPRGATVNDTESNASNAKTLDSRWPLVRGSVKEILDFIVKSEEAAHDKDVFQKMSDPGCAYDWSENHFLGLGDGKEEPTPKKGRKSSKRVNVITHSYYLNNLASKLDPKGQIQPFSVCTDGDMSSPWLRFDRGTENNHCSEANEDDFIEIIERLDCMRNNIPSYKDLSVEEVALTFSFSDVARGKYKSLNKEEQCSLIGYLRHLVEKRASNLNKALFKLRGEVENGTTELLLGLVHVRMRYTTGEGEKKKHRIVNGPLLEIPLELDYDEDNHSASLSPRKNACFRVNGSVLSCLRSGGDDDAHPDTIKSLLEKVQETPVSKLAPGKPEALSELLKIAKMIRFNSSFTSGRSPDAHKIVSDPEGPTLFSDAWCLYSCKSKNSEKVFLQDATNLRKAMDADDNFEIPPAFYALTGKPTVLDEIAKFYKPETCGKSQLLFPLPATKDQQNIAKKLRDGAPAVVAQAPAGNGKTHSIANCVAAAVSQGQKCCISSSNPMALRAFVDKLPGDFKSLCVDFSSCENGNVTSFSKCLHSLQEHLEKVVNNTEEHESNIEAHKKLMEDKKGKLLASKEEQRRRGDTIRVLQEDEETASILCLSTDLTMEVPWLVSIVVSNDGNTFFEELKQLAQYEQREANETSRVDFNVDHDRVDFKLLAAYINMQMSPSGGEEFESDPFDDVNHVASTTKAGGAVPHSMTVDRNPPSSCDQWQRCLRYNDLLRRRDAFFRAWSCCKQHIYDCSSGGIRPQIIRCIPQCDNLSNKLRKLPGEKQAIFFKELAESSDSKKLQAECRQLNSEIQELSYKLVFEQFVVDLGKKLTPDDLSSLERLMQQVDIQASNALSGSKGTLKPADRRHLLTLTESFQEAVKFLPFVAMTDKQVSQHVLPTHKFDLMVVDEASQSNYKAITSLLRGRQLLVVGDSKQVTPTSDISEERLKELEICLPNIPVKHSLLPESSVFDLCKRCFPQYIITLKHHFRSDPRIIGISNECFYEGRLVPLKSPGNGQAVEFVERVNGQAVAKVNQDEAKYIVERILTMIEAAFLERKLTNDTIGVICLDGPIQCETIEALLEEKLEKLRLRLGGKRIVDSHKILVDVPEGFQGDERDVVFVSAVCSVKQDQKPKKTPTLSIETSPAFKKKLNVTLTRSKKKLVWVSSYDMKNLKSGDVRVDVLNALKEASRDEEDPMWSNSVMSQGIEGKLVSQLRDQGLNVQRNGGRIWSDALLIRHPSTPSNALLHLEHVKGDSEAKWIRLVDEQESLERAKRACLRVDVVSLTLNFETTLSGVMAFLKEAGLPTADTGERHSASAEAPVSRDSPMVASIMAPPASISDLDESSKSDSSKSDTSMTKSKMQIVQRDSKRHAEAALDTTKTNHKRAKTVLAADKRVAISLNDAQKAYKVLETKKAASAVVKSGKDVEAMTRTELKAMIDWKTGTACRVKSKREELLTMFKNVFKDPSEMVVHWEEEDEVKREQCKSIIAAAANDDSKNEMS